MNVRAAIFDVDGTLLDTAPGVEQAVRFAERELGLEPLPETELRKFVGPPPREMYRRLYGLSDSDALRATELHRKFGREEGLFHSRPYPGMPAALQRLSGAGVKLGVATLKIQDVAERILEYHGLRAQFSAVVGVDAGESRTKRQTILLALEAMGERPGNAVMIGDSAYDAEGAQAAGVGFVGVLYGYGFRREAEILRTPGAKCARSAQEIVEEILQ